MTEYVTKEKVLAQLERCARDPYHETHYIRDAVINTIRRMEAADVAEVVRCKDCVYYQDNNNGYPHNECRWRSDETPDADDFCSMAERRRHEIDRR